MKKGDKVRHTVSGKTGIIIKVEANPYIIMGSPQSSLYTVEFQDKSTLVCSAGDIWPEDNGVLPKSGDNTPKAGANTIKKKTCSCGVSSARAGGRHSDWCDLF